MDVQLEVNPEQQEIVWAHLVELWGDEEFIAALAAVNDAHHDPLVLDMLERNPDLLDALNPSQESWRRWWSYRVTKGAGVWQGISDPTTVRNKLLTLSPKNWPQPVLEAISKTSQANMLDWPPRTKLWKALPTGFLIATARAWLDDAAFPSIVEQEVIAGALQLIDGQIPQGQAMRLLTLSAEWVPGNKLDLLLQCAGTEWSPQLKVTLQQRAIRDNRTETWFDQDQSRRYKFPRDFFQPLFEYLHPIQKVRYLRVTPGGVPEDLWWVALRDKAVATFGNNLDQVWRDLGGKLKHLQHHGTLENQWFHALNRMRETGKPYYGDLLTMIGQEDHRSDDSKVLWETRPYDYEKGVKSQE